ncbi:SDR family oxidoreductase [Afifella sp. IM 167]|uniref:SDR family NAD(P)-dependent oxidoreductase n=1 Tax=Afifella sp. IM 167 TaxID=2033586 RepID=UPI001CC9DB64|nr:SDR family NAD(P)-dependent oxidoreductase [Afifella sp. IM 167]MBZ8134344.1 oxidoreductase [Afifella sp. IM 167]
MVAENALGGRIALVTGASRGIGAASALALAKAGAEVVVTARSLEGLEPVSQAIAAAGGKARPFALDMRDGAAIARFGETVEERFGRLDVLVANAGLLGSPARAVEIDPQAWKDIIAVNLTGNVDLVRALGPLLARSDAGRAVFVTSGLAWRRQPGLGAYAASKAALNAFVEAYAAETRDGPLRVNLFSPGAVRTELYANAFPQNDLSAAAAPEEVAEALLACCLPSVAETGKVWDFRSGRWMELMPPA